MPEWHIEFDVTHKYYADAQAAIHQLRGVSNVSARPHAEVKKRQPSNGGVIFRDVLCEIMLTADRALRGKEVVELLRGRGIETTMKKTTTNLGNMERAGLVRRIRPGTFAITKKGRERVKAHG